MEKHKFELNKKEKGLKKAFICLLFCITLIILKGIYNQTIGIDEDQVLFPLLLILTAIFSIIYSINAFENGNLVNNLRATYISNFIIFKLIKHYKMTYQNASKVTSKIFGFFTLFIFFYCILEAVFYFFNDN